MKHQGLLRDDHVVALEHRHHRALPRINKALPSCGLCWLRQHPGATIRHGLGVISSRCEIVPPEHGEENPSR